MILEELLIRKEILTHFEFPDRTKRVIKFHSRPHKMVDVWHFRWTFVLSLTWFRCTQSQILPRDCRVDVGFVLDGSGSVQEANWLMMLDFIRVFASRVPFGPQGARVGVVSFGNEGTVNLALNAHQNLRDFERAVGEIPYKNENTNTASGLRALRMELFQTAGDRGGAANVGIVLTDGGSTWGRNNTIPEANRAHRANVRMFAIAIGPSYNLTELQAIANDPNDQFLFFVPRFTELESLIIDLVPRVCSFSQTTPVTPTPRPRTTTTTTTTITPQTSTPTTRTTTTTIRTPTPTAGACTVDIGFLLDGSGSVREANWRVMLTFISVFASHINFGPGGARIGVASFGNEGSLNLALDQFGDLANFTQAVMKIAYKDENTNTAAGLRVLRRELFQPTGDRVGVSNIAILLTDGPSTTESQNTVPEAEFARLADIKLFVIGIGIGARLNEAEMKAIANDPDSDFVFFASSFTDLERLSDNLIERVCSYTGFAPSSSTTTSSSTSTPTTTTTTTTTAATTTTTTEGTPAGCQNLDLAFILDSSGSVGFANWLQIKDLVKSFVRRLTLGQETGASRVGVVQYSTQAVIRVNLGQFTDHQDFDDAVDEMRWIQQRTNTSGALRVASLLLSASERGDRPDRPNVAVLITEDTSNTDEMFIAREAERLRSTGTRVFAIGIGNRTSMEELKSIASKPHYWHLVMTAGFQDIHQVEQTLVDRVCAARIPPEETPASNKDCEADIIIALGLSGVSIEMARDTIKDVVAAFGFNMALQAGNVVAIVYSHIGVLYIEGPVLPGVRANLVQVPILARTDVDVNFLVNFIRTTVAPSFDRPNVPTAILLMTDLTVTNMESLQHDTGMMKSTNYSVFLLAGDAIKDEEGMTAITSEPTELFFNTIEGFNDAAALRRSLDKLWRDMCMATAYRTWSCDFELDGIASMCDLSDDLEAQFTWTLSSGKTPSKHTGPQAANSGQHYAYTEASSPQQSGDKAILRLPPTAVPGAGFYCFRFYYHMVGWHIGTLSIFIRRQNRDIIQWMLTGPQSQGLGEWKLGMVEMVLQLGDVIGICGIRAKGFSGDIALDNMYLLKGPCQQLKGVL